MQKIEIKHLLIKNKKKGQTSQCTYNLKCHVMSYTVFSCMDGTGYSLLLSYSTFY